MHDLFFIVYYLHFCVIFSPFSMYSWSVSQVYLWVVCLFTASYFSFCIVDFIILSHDLILFSFYLALLGLRIERQCALVRHTDSEAICTHQLYSRANYWTSLYLNSSAVKQKNNSNFLKNSGDKCIVLLKNCWHIILLNYCVITMYPFI